MISLGINISIAFRVVYPFCVHGKLEDSLRNFHDNVEFHSRIL
jgi:hypothetical protein